MLSRVKKKGWADGLVWGCLVCLVLILIKDPEKTSALVSRGLDICVRSLIPAIFPFSVLGTLLCSLEAPRWVSSAVSRIFKVSPSGSCAVIAGYLSGFPIGALCVSRLYKSGRITRAESERLICFINNPSAPFVIGVVGSGVLGSVRLGVIMYVIILAVSVLAGITVCRCAVKSDNCVADSHRYNANLPTFTEVVYESALSMLAVCATVVVFSVIGGYLAAAVSPLGSVLSCIVCGAAELSNGVSMVKSSVISKEVGFELCSALCAFSGVSVHLQVASALRGTGIGMKLYFVTKLVSSVVISLVAWLITLLF